MPGKLTLYYSPGACSLASHIVLEETGLSSEARKIDFSAAEQRSVSYLALNPKGRVPALVHDDAVITESPAILRYLTRLAPEASLWPEDPLEEARCCEWMAWLSSSLHVAYAHVRRIERYADSEAAKAEVKVKGLELCRQLWPQLENKLKSGQWALGERYSVVDPYLFVFWNWGRGDALRFDMAAEFPRWTDHARRLSQRPAARRVLEREGLALPS